MIKLSIVTVFKFGEIGDLERTMASVQKQKHKPYQHTIVISGVQDFNEITHGQNKNYEEFIVNKDRSIYDAMNIGLENSKGDAVIFLNGGDEFYSNRAIEIISSSYRSGLCLAMRTIQHYDGDIYVRPSSSRMEDLSRYPSHQAFVAPLPIAKCIHFNESKIISADYYWMKELVEHCGIVISDEILSVFALGGISNYPTLKTVKLRLCESGLRRSFIEFIKLLGRLTLGNRNYYRALLQYKTD